MSFPDGPEFSFHLKLGSITQYLLTFTRIRGPKAPSYHGFFLWLGLTGSGGHDTNYKSQGEVAVRESGERMDWPSAEHLSAPGTWASWRVGEALALAQSPGFCKDCPLGL